jgi:hypothetical protein
MAVARKSLAFLNFLSFEQPPLRGLDKSVFECAVCIATYEFWLTASSEQKLFFELCRRHGPAEKVALALFTAHSRQ